jgi:uncharacterized protein Veg
MTCSNQDTQFGELLELVAEKGNKKQKRGQVSFWLLYINHLISNSSTTCSWLTYLG